MKVYLDDVRPAPPGWIRTYTAKSTIVLLETGEVDEVSLDHDLGARATGYDVLLWLEEKVLTDTEYYPPKVYVHTANTSAEIKMKQAAKKINAARIQRTYTS